MPDQPPASQTSSLATSGFRAVAGAARIKTYALSFNGNRPIGLSHRELICNHTDKVLKRTRLHGVLINWAKRHGYAIESKEKAARCYALNR